MRLIYESIADRKAGYRLSSQRFCLVLPQLFDAARPLLLNSSVIGLLAGISGLISNRFSMQSVSGLLKISIGGLGLPQGFSINNDVRLKMYGFQQDHYSVRVAYISFENAMNTFEYTILYHNCVARANVVLKFYITELVML